MAMLFFHDFIRYSLEERKSLKCTGELLFQKPFSSLLKSGRPAEVLKPAPERNVISSFSSRICFKALK